MPRLWRCINELIENSLFSFKRVFELFHKFIREIYALSEGRGNAGKTAAAIGLRTAASRFAVSTSFSPSTLYREKQDLV